MSEVVTGKLDQIRIPKSCPAGTILTQKVIATVHSTNRRALLMATAIVTAILIMGAGAGAQQPSFIAKPEQAAAKETGDKRLEGQTQRADSGASIAGTIFDQSGAVIPGASVRLTNRRTDEERTVISSQDGEYRFDRVEEGSYRVKVDSENFQSALAVPVKVRPGHEVRVDFTLQVAGLCREPNLIPEKPLRKLYSESELIVVGRAGKSVVVGSKGTAKLLETPLEVTSTLKGERTEQVVNLYDWNYGGAYPDYVSGNTLLLFLKRTSEQVDEKKHEGYEVVDTQRGAKWLYEADLRVYIQRIGELAAISSKLEADSKKEVIEWLVRCAEEKGTRWEGVYELLHWTSGLNPDQKQRLTQTLLKIGTIQREDRDLIKLVNNWDRPRVVAFLLEQLKRVDVSNLYNTVDIPIVLASILEDKELEDIAKWYAEQLQSGEGSEEASWQRAETLREFISLAENRLKK